MPIYSKSTLLALLALAWASTAQSSIVDSVGGSYNGLQWNAHSTIVGVTSTATLAAGGDPRYLANTAQYSGTVSLIMDYGAAGQFICSGSLLNDRRSILTAGHCVSDGEVSGPTGRPLSTKAYFYDYVSHGDDPQTFLDSKAVAINISQYFVNSLYTGQVIDQNDIAVLRLADFAPAFATSYGLLTTPDLTGLDLNVAGYGGRSLGGGNDGANLVTGRLRQGDNRYDFRLGDADFGGFFTDMIGARAEYSYVSDFDNGLEANDASCLVAASLGLSGSKYCNLGTGADEVSTAGGDSGGPEFHNGLIASVTSYGLTFGTGLGDISAGLNSSFGEFQGYVPVFLHSDFINGALFAVPEPASLALFGIGLAGLAMSRRKQAS